MEAPFRWGSHLITAACVFSTIACNAPGPDLPETQTTFLVYDYSAPDDTYVLVESEITSLSDPRAIRGDVAELFGGGRIVLNHSQPQTAAEFENSLEVRDARAPSAEYFLDDGVAVPFDFDTQMMVTLYHHLERATEYFESVGFDRSRIGTMPTYYFPQLAVLGISVPLFTDNAAYAFTLDAFVIPPNLVLGQDVPLSANRGVIVHEYAHAVFNRVVHRDRRAPTYLLQDYGTNASDAIRSLDEGLADVFAGLATGDPDFISPSVSSTLFEVDRDLDRTRIWNIDLQLRVDATRDANGDANPYILGSVFASAVWATRHVLGDVETATAILAALETISEPPPDFRATDFFNAYLDQFTPQQRGEVCEILTERLQVAASDLSC